LETYNLQTFIKKIFAVELNTNNPKQTKTMKHLKSISLLILTVMIAASCGNSDTSSLASKKAKLDELKADRKKLNDEITKLEGEIALLDSNANKNSKAKLVTTQDLKFQPFTNYIEIMGKVDADQNTNVSTEIPGTLIKIHVTVGQNVTVGQTIGEIDNSVSIVAVNELKQQLEFAKTLYEKQKNLWEQKIGSELQYLNAKNNYESLQKRLATTNQQLGMARIKAPVSGVIDDIYVKTGQTVAPGMPCFRIVNFNKLKIKAELAESFAGKIKEGNQVKLFFPDLKLETEGKVSYSSRVIDPVNRAFKIEIPLATNPDYKPNMLAKIKIVNYYSEKSIVVPVNTVRTVGEESYVLVAETKNGKLRATKKIVTFVNTYNGMTEITSGLAEGDKLITVGYQELEDGDEIKL
jgi:RND family efflux transporter MFP subunit